MDDLLFDADEKLCEAERLVKSVQTSLPEVDADTRRELATILNLIRRVKRKIPATLAAA